MYYLCSENKGSDQLRGYGETDLRLCFRICKKPVFSRRGSMYNDFNFLYDGNILLQLSRFGLFSLILFLNKKHILCGRNKTIIICRINFCCQIDLQTINSSMVL